MTSQKFDPAIRPPTQMRRNRQHLAKDDQWIKDFLKQAQICTVSTAWNNQPFNNATLFWYDEAQHRLIFHANVIGRVRANLDQNPQVCISVQEMGKLLPSNAAVEFSVQYRGVVIFGEAEIIEDPSDARYVLDGLIAKYFPKMTAGQEYRPITDDELNHTSVCAVKITEWSGKENWKDMADQTDEWEPLSAAILAGGFADD